MHSYFYLISSLWKIRKTDSSVLYQLSHHCVTSYGRSLNVFVFEKKSHILHIHIYLLQTSTDKIFYIPLTIYLRLTISRQLIEWPFVSGRCSFCLVNPFLFRHVPDNVTRSSPVSSPPSPPSISLHPCIYVISHLLIFLALFFSFESSHPSILLAGWPKSCAFLELCSGRCKLSLALCSHTFPPLS